MIGEHKSVIDLVSLQCNDAVMHLIIRVIPATVNAFTLYRRKTTSQELYTLLSQQQEHFIALIG